MNTETNFLNEKNKELFNLQRVEVGISEYLFGEEFKDHKEKWVIYKLAPECRKEKKVIAKNLVTKKDKHFSVAAVIKATNFISLRQWLDKNNLEAFLL